MEEIAAHGFQIKCLACWKKFTMLLYVCSCSLYSYLDKLILDLFNFRHYIVSFHFISKNYDNYVRAINTFVRL